MASSDQKVMLHGKEDELSDQLHNAGESGVGVGEDSRKNVRPFQFARNTFHISRSLKNSLFSRMW